jgi:hypothetical protein
MVPGDGTEVLLRCGEYTYEQGELRGIVGEEGRGKEMDGYPLTVTVLPLLVHVIATVNVLVVTIVRALLI